jgi:hypothetical protein
MAVNNETSMTSTVRRLFFGANVVVVVLLATAVLIGVNVIGRSPKLSARKDLAGGLSAHRVSERTKGILAQYPDELTITTIYTSDEPDSDRKEYLPRLQDYLSELAEVKRNIKVQHLHSGNERAELRQRIQGKFGEAAEKYKEAVAANDQIWTNLDGIVKNLHALSKEQLAGGGWLSRFSALANIEAVLRKDIEEMEENRRAVNDLVRGEGIPRYQEANTKIKSTNDAFKQHLEATQTWMRETDKLVKVLSQADSEFAAKSRENLGVLQGLVLNMRKAVGNAADRDAPADPVAMIKEYGKAANALSRWLFDEHNRVSAFIKDNPGLEQHPHWIVRVQVGGLFEQNLPLHELLENTATQLSETVEAVRRVVADPSKVDELTLKNVAMQLRQNTGQVEKTLAVWTKNVGALLDDVGTIDEKSRQFLERGVSGELFQAAVPATQPGSEAGPPQSIITQLTDSNARIDALPKLEIDQIADRMKEDNIVVIETAKSVRIVPFDEVWAAAAPDAAPMGEERPKLHRVFDGDRAISSTIDTLMASKKVATVIITAFESEPPPQMRQMQRPNTGPIPLSQMATLKDRLEKANFTVKEWNLGATGENATKGPPAPDEGTQAIYLFLPPAETPPPNPMMQQAPPPGFGPEQLEQVKAVLASGARAIFLAFADAMPRRPWDPPASYAYADMLREDWGVDVKFDHRVIRGVRDSKRPDHFNIDIVQWSFMPLNNFTDHPIGAPLKARRLLMAEVCPVIKTATLPEGVKVSPVLEVPASAQDIWASSDISQIFKGLREGLRDSSFTKGKDVMDKGFSVIAASENEKTKGKIVVMGMGFSFIDAFLSRPVPRLEAKKAVTLSTDPPPTENLDLALNSLFWLADQPKLIASGPALTPLIGPIAQGEQRSVYIVSLGWAFAALILGAAVMFVRRK